MSKPDYEMSPAELDDKYNPNGNGQHPVFTRKGWRVAVEHEHTISGYWQWLSDILWEQHEDEINS